MHLGAKSILYTKLLNFGQILNGPDVVFCHEDLVDNLVDAIKDSIKSDYNDCLPPDYNSKPINKEHHDNLRSLLQDHGGKLPLSTGSSSGEANEVLAPTVIVSPKASSPLLNT